MPGTPTAGYMGPEHGPFHCANCKHFSAGNCDDKEVIQDLGANKSGKASVSPDGCCNEFDPRSKAEKKSPKGTKKLQWMP